MGVGFPPDLLDGIARGVDLFDCVAATRNGRHGTAWLAVAGLTVLSRIAGMLRASAIASLGANALTALWTAVWGSDDVWFYYNGIIAYLLAGLMFAGEWFLRRRVLRALGW